MLRRAAPLSTRALRRTNPSGPCRPSSYRSSSALAFHDAGLRHVERKMRARSEPRARAELLGGHPLLALGLQLVDREHAAPARDLDPVAIGAHHVSGHAVLAFIAQHTHAVKLDSRARQK